MAINIPELDTIDYTKLRTDTEEMLAENAPQWTDYNLSDPGITFLELFSWLADIELYRLNRITPEHLKKFLLLLGDTHPTATASKGIIVSNQSINSNVRIKHGNIIEINTKNKKIFFHTSNTFYANPAKIDSIDVLGNSEENSIRYVENKKIEPFYAFGLTPKNNNYFRLNLSQMPSKRLKLYIELEESDLPPYPDTWKEDYLWLKKHDTVVLEWYINIDKERYLIFPKEDCTLNLRYSGNISFILSEAITEISTVSIECRLKNTAYMIAPFINNIYLNTLEVTQAQTIIETIVSTGKKSQNITFEKPYVLDNKTNKIIIQTKNSKGEVSSWRRVDSLSNSSQEDKDFIYDNTTQKITFGNGEHGLVVPYGESIIAQYSISEGSQGIIPHTIKNWNVQEISFYNPQSIEGGKNIPSYHERFSNIVENWNKPSQAVTLKDYEKLAKMTTGLRVARTKAVADKRKNTVSILVIPYSRSNYAMPDDFFCQRVCRFLEKRRLITTRITVVKPSYTQVGIRLDIKTHSNVDDKSIRLYVIKKINDYLHPLKGGDNKEGWEFGRAIYLSDIYALIEEIEGISCLLNLSFYGNGHYDHNKKVYRIPKDSLIETLTHQITFIQSHLTCGGSK